MNVTYKKLEGHQLLACLTGFNKKQGLSILHQWCDYCAIKDCVTRMHWLKEPIYANYE